MPLNESLSKEITPINMIKSKNASPAHSCAVVLNERTPCGYHQNTLLDNVSSSSSSRLEITLG
jgi:hypothetical protein